MPNYRPYPDYQPTNIDWLGNIPVDWNVAKVKHVSKVFNGATPKSGELQYWDGNISWVTPADFGKSDDPYIYSGSRSITLEGLNSCGTSLVPAGSVVISSRAPIGTVGIAGQELCTNQGCKSLVPTQLLDSKFLYYLLKSSKEQLNILGKGTTFLELSSDEMGTYRICLPSEVEQKVISLFLDRETAKIDQLIAKQQQLIELLKEKRQAVISHAVTKGLNPNVKMKASGVEWLGDVPEHWDIRSISRLSSKITNGYVGPTRDILVPVGIPYVQATHIKNGRVNFDDAYFVEERWSNRHEKSILQSGDVLIVQTGAGTGDIGIVTKDEEGFNCHALIIIQPINEVISGEFLSKALQSQYGYSVLYSIRTGGMHPHLNCSDVQYVKLPIPSRTEQDEIMQYLQAQNEKFDVLMAKAERQIGLLRERRAALISAAVTGKIDVRDKRN